jgi:hypothetical protein
MRPVGISMGNWSPQDDTERRKDMQAILDVGFSGMRVDLAWGFTVNREGTINTNKARLVGTAMKDLGMLWNACLAYTPLQYSMDPTTVMAAPKPEYYSAWEDWVRIQVSTILGTGLPPKHIKIEIWNEPNWYLFWRNPNPYVYVQLLKIARRVVHELSPDVKVSFAGMAPAPTTSGKSFRSSDFVAACYQAHMTGFDFDYMGLHPYNGQNPLSETAGRSWDMNTTILDEICTIMAAHNNPKKRFDFTEFGYSTKGKRPLTEDVQGKLIIDQINFLRNHPRCDMAFLFNWKDLSSNGSDQNAGYGLHKPDGTPKKAVAMLKSYFKANPSVLPF